MTRAYKVKTRAIDLQRGDLLVGPSVDFTERGEVENTVVVDGGVQINFLGGLHIVRPEDYTLLVEQRA